jgi:hypothetical protein
MLLGALVVSALAMTTPAHAVDPPPYTKANPASHDFGTQKVGVPSTSVDFLVSNDYGFPIDFTTNTWEGPDAGDFSITANSCTSDSFGNFDYCHIHVRFTPSSAGPKSATLVVESRNAPPSPNYYYRSMRIPLSGTGAVPQLSATPDPLSFGNQRVGTPSTEQVMTVTNTGAVPLEIQSNDVVGPDAGEFQIIYDTCWGSDLQPTATCEVWYVFTPVSAGAKTAGIEVISDAQGSPQTVPISATGTVPQVAVDPAEVNFGDQVVGTTSPVTSVTVSNTGGADMDASEVTLSDSTSFSITSQTCTAAKIPAGGTCNVNLTFSPATTGAKNTALKIVSDAANTPTLDVAVRGTGIAPGTGVGTGQSPTTTALRDQTSAQSAALPARIKRKGLTVIVPAKASTNAGQPIRTTVKATPKRSPKGTKTHRVITKKSGKVAIRTFGYKKLRVKITLSAPAITGYSAYAVQATYYKGKRR